MMSPGGAMLILLPAVFLLCGAAWAATLGGLGGECNQQGGRKEKKKPIALSVMMKSEVDFI